MKKFAILFIAIAASLTSCSDDNDSKSASLTGEWEFSREGSIIDGEEVFTDYVHTEGCERDFIQITETTVVTHEFAGPDCIESVSNATYTRVGNDITVTQDGTPYSGEITTLTSTTLTIKRSFEFEGSSFVLLTTFSRRQAN